MDCKNTMRIGVISDAHGNYDGLTICIDFLKGRCEKIFFLGDAVGYFPFPNEVIDILRSNNIVCLLGNHDAMLTGELTYPEERENIYKILESRKKISATNFDFLKKLPRSKEILFDGKKILFVHGNPADTLNGYIYPDTDLSPFHEFGFDVVFMGHTHRSFLKQSGNKLFINAGSCGFSRDNGNKITAVVFDTLTMQVLLKTFIINKQEVINKFGPFLHESVVSVLNRNNIYEA